MLTDDEIDALWSHIETIDTAEAGRVLVRTAISAVLEKLTAGVEVPEAFGLFCGVRHDPPKTKEFWGMLSEDAPHETKCNLFTRDQLLAYGASQRLAGQQRETCTWTEQDDPNLPGVYATGCGGMFVFNEGGVKDHGFSYCQYCGNEIALAASPQEQT